MKKPPYFSSFSTDVPLPLSHTVSRVSRFEEVDLLNVVWHGRYPSYFEDARVAFGERYGLSYLDYYRAGCAIPIKHIYLDYLAPIRFAQEVHITARLHYTEAARLNFEYAIHAADGNLVTTGYTVQLFLDAASNHIMLTPPEIYLDFCQRWKEGRLA